MSAAALRCRYRRAFRVIGCRHRRRPGRQKAFLDHDDILGIDKVANLFERVLRARAPQHHIEQRPDQFRGGAQQVHFPGDQVESGQFLALDQHIVRDHERPDLAIELQFDLADEFVCDCFSRHRFVEIFWICTDGPLVCRHRYTEACSP